MASKEIRELKKNSIKVGSKDQNRKIHIPMRTKIKTNLDPFYNETKEKKKRCDKC